MKSNLSSIITRLLKELIRRTQMFWIVKKELDKFAFSFLCVKLKLGGLWGHKVGPFMSCKFGLSDDRVSLKYDDNSFNFLGS